MIRNMNTSLCYLVYFQSLLLLFITLIHVSLFASTTTCITTDLAHENKTDEVALRAFKSKIDPQGVLNSWNDSRHFCQWEGIMCGRRHKRVTILDLSSRGLQGSLSPYIGNLSFLRELILSDNNIQGEIPHEFGRLFRLTSLLLLNNSLVGKIPQEFVSLYNLKMLHVHKNKLEGNISPFLGNLTSLESLSLSYNAFRGNIPDSLGRLRNLAYLALDGNNLSGTVPSSFYNLPLLSHFSLSQNQLHGSLPPNLGLTLPNLKFFQISHNLFNGSIPVSLSNASKLERFDISNNSFFGKLSVDFGGMQHLRILNLALNHLGSDHEIDDMDFINSLVNCSHLWALDLGSNQFKGVLPHSIANFSTTFQHLTISTNQLYGNIFPAITNLVNLSLLDVSHNQFTGQIPREIGELQNLQKMVLSDNQFSWEIPSSIGNLSLVFELSLDTNKLSGVIPSSIGNLKQLSILNLSQNNLSGRIPEQIFDITHLSVSLNLAQNHLVGPLPPNIGKLISLTNFDVSDNNLSGEIPHEIGLCSSLEYLYMKGNFFNGSIRPSLSLLRAIREMDFSHNNFSGQIPTFLESLRLQNLNLSFNDLEGEVPMKGVFMNASEISIFGNYRLCGGIAQLNLSRCLEYDSMKEKDISIYKILVVVKIVFFGFSLLLVSICCLYIKRKAITNSYLRLNVLLVSINDLLKEKLRKEKKERQAFGPMLRNALLRVSYERLFKATNGFSSSNLIGVGSFGSMYKGILDQEGTIVAIKVLNLQCQGAFESFMAECKALKSIRHRNLLKVITSCSGPDFQGNDFKAIIYEFMTNGSLENWLHPIEEGLLEIQSLTLIQRINIAIDVASALDYLHHHYEEPIIHRDLKPSNVLLDSDMTSCVGDFGLAKFVPEIYFYNESSSFGVRGTIGYIAPEYGLGNKMSTNGDVYSYGILLLEMVTRIKPTDPMFEGGLNLHNLSRMALPDRVMEIVDPILVNEKTVLGSNQRTSQTTNMKEKECLISMVRIGVACSMESPQDRMNIRDVVRELQLVRDILLQPASGFNMQRGQRS